MVLERIFTPKSIQKHLEYPLYIGVIFTLISFLTAWLLFKQVPHLIGISTILFIVVLTIPLVSKLLRQSEEWETRGKKGFLQSHKVITDFFVYFFIGIFLTLFVLSLALPNMVFSENQLFGGLSTTQNVFSSSYQPGLPPPPAPSLADRAVSIFQNNLFVMLILFALSLFYGSGAIFLLTLNASIFASSLARVVRVSAPSGFGFLQSAGFLTCNIGVMFLHMLPEVGAYLLAAIAGGILSHSVSRSKDWKRHLRKVLPNVLILMAIAIILLYLASLIEVFGSQKLFLAGTCLERIPTVNIFLLVLAGLILGWYLLRRVFKQ